MDERKMDAIVDSVLEDLLGQASLNPTNAPLTPRAGIAPLARDPRNTPLRAVPTVVGTPRVAVMGGGHGGLATAGHLTLKGFPVTLFSFFESELSAVRERGGLELVGEVEGFARIDRVTTAIDEAVGDADIVFLVYPALVHRPAAAILAGAFRDGQTILLTPGRTGGALEFANTLKRFAVQARVYLAEAQTFMYAVEKRGPAKVEIAGEKHTMQVAALPARDNEAVMAALTRLYPQVRRARNVLETSLNNVGAVFHPAPMMLNLPAIERAAAGEHIRHYRELITPSICHMVLEPLDAERVAVARAMGVDAWSALDWFRESYGVTGDGLYEVLSTNPHYAEFAAPSHFLGYHHILDEVPNSLVPIACFGQLVGVPTPTIHALVDLASAMCGFDFWREGRTLASLGLAGLSREEIIRYVEHGTIEGKCAGCGLCLLQGGHPVTLVAHAAGSARRAT